MRKQSSARNDSFNKVIYDVSATPRLIRRLIQLRSARLTPAVRRTCKDRILISYKKGDEGDKSPGVGERGFWRGAMRKNSHAHNSSTKADENTSMINEESRGDGTDTAEIAYEICNNVPLRTAKLRRVSEEG